MGKRGLWVRQIVLKNQKLSVTIFSNRYLFYLLAFALGFYILLHKDNDGQEVDDDGKGKEDHPFDFIGLAVVKTLAMFVGELEFGDLPINSTVGYLFLIGEKFAFM